MWYRSWDSNHHKQCWEHEECNSENPLPPVQLLKHPKTKYRNKRTGHCQRLDGKTEVVKRKDGISNGENEVRWSILNFGWIALE